MRAELFLLFCIYAPINVFPQKCGGGVVGGGGGGDTLGIRQPRLQSLHRPPSHGI